MANKRSDTTSYGMELGAGIKEGLKGLNTVASPKKRKTCIILTLIPLAALPIGMIGGKTNNDAIIGILPFFLLANGACQFYVGKFKRGLLYTFTWGFLFLGLLGDLFKLTITNTFRDANGFPVIY